MIFYRYEDMFYESGPKIDLLKFEMIRETPKGWWISPYYPFGWYEYDERRRWVSKTAVRRYAYPTKKEALHNYRMRKIRQMGILRAKLADAKALFALINNVDTTDEED